MQVHPEAAPYRKYKCPLYNDLCTLFTKPRATGQHVISFGGGGSTRVNNSSARGSNNKRKSSQPLGSAPGKRIATATQNTGVVIKIKGTRFNSCNYAYVVWLIMINYLSMNPKNRRCEQLLPSKQTK